MSQNDIEIVRLKAEVARLSARVRELEELREEDARRHETAWTTMRGERDEWMAKADLRDRAPIYHGKRGCRCRFGSPGGDALCTGYHCERCDGEANSYGHSFDECLSWKLAEGACRERKRLGPFVRHHGGCSAEFMSTVGGDCSCGLAAVLSDDA